MGCDVVIEVLFRRFIIHILDPIYIKERIDNIKEGIATRIFPVLYIDYKVDFTDSLWTRDITILILA